MKTKSILKMSVLLVLSLMLGICMSCGQGNATHQQAQQPPIPRPPAPQPSVLDEIIIQTGGTEDDLRGYYFSGGVVYGVRYYWSTGACSRHIAGSYSGNSFTTKDGTITCEVTPTELVMHFSSGSSRSFPRVTDQDLVNAIKNAPVN